LLAAGKFFRGSEKNGAESETKNHCSDSPSKSRKNGSPFIPSSRFTAKKSRFGTFWLKIM